MHGDQIFPGCSNAQLLVVIRVCVCLFTGYSNGQLLAKLTATVEGICRSRLLFDYEEVPDSLISQDVSVSITCPTCTVDYDRHF